MTYQTIGGISVSRIAQGCMRIDRLTRAELDALIRSDLDAGISFFEHADIYGGNGRCSPGGPQPAGADDHPDQVRHPSGPV